MSLSSFVSLHQQIIQERKLNSLLTNEINQLRESIDTSLRVLISELRKFSLQDIWYPKLSESDVANFLQSSIYKRGNNIAYETPSSLPLPTSVTSKVNNFLRNLHLYFPLLLKCIDKYFDSSGNAINLPFITNPSTYLFFASSTFPALYGYCWCVEHSTAYVEDLCTLINYQIKACSSVTSSRFRNSYLKDLIRQFFHNNGIQKFLQLALSKDLNRFLYDDNFEFINENSLDYIIILLKYAVKFVDSLIFCIPKIPSIIRYFFARSYQVAKNYFPEDSNEPLQLMEFLFFNMILQPAMLNPKLFGLITETAVVHRSNHLTSLTKLFRWKLNYKIIPASYIQKGILYNDTFKQLNVSLILEKLSVYDGDIEGIFAKNVQDVTNIMSRPLLLSLNDVAYLAEIVTETIDSIEIDESQKTAKSKFKDLCDINSLIGLDKDELIDFWFQSFQFNPKEGKQKAHEKQELVLPIVQINEPEQQDVNKETMQ